MHEGSMHRTRHYHLKRSIMFAYIAIICKLYSKIYIMLNVIYMYVYVYAYVINL